MDLYFSEHKLAVEIDEKTIWIGVRLKKKKDKKTKE